jgi:glucose/arabinose dehydrogenase
MYVSARAGTVHRVDLSGTSEIVLDVGPLRVDGQGGLMSLTFDPSGEWLYLSYSTRDPELVNYVRAYQVSPDGRVDPTPSTILTVPQPVDIHNLTKIVFGPDGMMYIGSGDGGSPEFGLDIRMDGQNTSTLHGAILRINPSPEAGSYQIPKDNPFVGSDGARQEIWAFGLREPWRFSFDAASGDLWIGDVGRVCFEEVNRVSFATAAGANFGWSGLEGFRRTGNEIPTEHVLPVHVYSRTPADEFGLVRCAVIGGHVYRGTNIPELIGGYIFADWCASQIQVLWIDDAGTAIVAPLHTQGPNIQSFVEGPNRELYVLDTAGLSLIVDSTD